MRAKRQHSKPLLKTFYNRSRKAVVDWFYLSWWLVSVAIGNLLSLLQPRHRLHMQFTSSHFRYLHFFCTLSHSFLTYFHELLLMIVNTACKWWLICLLVCYMRLFMLVNEAMTFESCSKERYRIAVVGHFTFHVCRFTQKNTAAGIATRSSMFRNKNRDDWSWCR